MRASVIKVTPILAKAWLEQNKSNRSLRPQRVNQYARDMKAGKWNLTGQGITFAEDGSLLDGQHRLNAIVVANVSVYMLVVFDAEVCGNYDGNLVRSTIDKFRMLDKPNNSLYTPNGQSIVRLAYLIDINRGFNSKINPTFEEISEYIESNYDELLWITSICCRGGHGAKNYQKVKGLRRGIIGATLYSVYRVSALSKYDVEHIVKVLQTGLSESEYDAPIIALRNKLIAIVGGGNDVNKELFLRIQFMCKQYLNKRTTFKSIVPKENVFKFK